MAVLPKSVSRVQSSTAQPLSPLSQKRQSHCGKTDVTTHHLVGDSQRSFIASSRTLAPTLEPTQKQAEPKLNVTEPSGLHFYTLNLERSVRLILDRLGYTETAVTRRAYPWRASALEKRAAEDVRYSDSKPSGIY